MVSTAFIFPGQGSQSVGMLQTLANAYPYVIECFNEVSESVGYDVWGLVQNGPLETLNKTEHTQVAMLTADVAVYRVLQQVKDIQPTIMAGHSLGEYAALVCANAITLPLAAKLVVKRGKLMQETVPLGQGAMAAIIGLADKDVQDICEQASHDHKIVTPANYNALGQIVIAGHRDVVHAAMLLAEEKGARMATQIPVSVPCHCPLLMQAAELFTEFLAEAPFKKPEISVISNVDLSIYQTPLHIRTLLQEQLYKPVRWVETIQLMKEKGVTYMIECGPGKVLSGLVKRIDKTITVKTVNDPANLEAV